MREQNNWGQQEIITVNGHAVHITYTSGGEGMDALHQLIRDAVHSSTIAQS